MPPFVKVRSFLRNLFLSRRVEADLDKEVRSHLELMTEENIRAGMGPEEAGRAARMELGGIEQVKEQVRDERTGNWIQPVISDGRFGVRQLRKNLGFSMVAIIALAMGIGFSTIIFSIFYNFVSISISRRAAIGGHRHYRHATQLGTVSRGVPPRRSRSVSQRVKRSKTLWPTPGWISFICTKALPSN